MNGEHNKFFLWVWRINGIAILIVAIFAGIFMLRIFTNIFWERPQDPVITNVAEDPEGKEKWVLGGPGYISGSNYILVPLVSENTAVDLRHKGGSASVSYGRRRIDPSKNVLFIDGTTNSSHWLFNSNDQLITEIEQFPYHYGSDAPDVRAVFYQVVLHDTNNDKVLNEQDQKSLAASKPDGSTYTVVIDNLDRVVSKSLAGESNVLIVYQNKGIGF